MYAGHVVECLIASCKYHQRLTDRTNLRQKSAARVAAQVDGEALLAKPRHNTARASTGTGKNQWRVGDARAAFPFTSWFP